MQFAFTAIGLPYFTERFQIFPFMYHQHSQRKRSKKEDKQLLQGIAIVTVIAIFFALLLVSGIFK